MIITNSDTKYSFYNKDISYNAFLRELIMKILRNWFALFDQGHEQNRKRNVYLLILFSRNETTPIAPNKI